MQRSSRTFPQITPQITRPSGSDLRGVYASTLSGSLHDRGNFRLQNNLVTYALPPRQTRVFSVLEQNEALARLPPFSGFSEPSSPPSLPPLLPSIPSPPLPSSVPPASRCGIRPSTRIRRVVGGMAAKVGEWPWQGMLRRNSGLPFCGGTLVAPLWLVTAAHCVQGSDPSSILVRLGAYKRISNLGNEQDFKVVKIISHPLYQTEKAYSHDIALLKLDKPAKLNRFVNLACLPQNVDAPTNNVRCWITGWGRNSSGGHRPEILHQASVPIASRARCDRAYPGLIHDSMICAGLDQGGVDACQGDSGGPMVCETAGKYYLQGATSWGFGCASPGKFGVYAKVKYLLKWINEEMAKN